MNKKLYYISIFVIVSIVFTAVSRCITIYQGGAIDKSIIPIAINFFLILSMLTFPNKNWRYGFLFILLSSISMHIPILFNITTLYNFYAFHIVACLLLIPAILFFIRMKQG